MPVMVLLFVAIFSLVVFVHELGHFLTAKLGGAQVKEFGFGYPPRLLRVATWRGTEYTINAIPFGGFVRVAGDENPSEPGSMAQKSPWLRAAFLLAGPAMNVVLAALLFGLSFTVGVLIPVEGPGVGIYDVRPGSPAAQTGLRLGDNIVAIDGQAVASHQQVQQVVQAKLGQEITLEIVRDGKRLPQPIRLTPRSNPPEGEGAMGVVLGDPLERISYPIWQAVWLGLRHTVFVILSIIGGLVAMVRGQISPELAGPIGIAQMTAQVAKSGWVQILEWTAFLSVNLFIINLLPFPALDGGRLVFVGIEIARGGRRVDPQKEGLVHLVGFVLLLASIFVVSYFDLVRLVQGGR